MIPDFKTFIKESIWSDIQDSSMGKTVRKEDAVNNLDRNEFYDYLKNKYNKFTHLISKDPSEIHIKLGWSYFPQRDYIIDIHWVEKNEIKNLYLNFGPCELNTLCHKNFKIGTSNDGISNEEILNIIDFCLDYISSHKEIESPLNESIWSDIQDRSMGKTVRKEDIALTLVIDGEKYTFLTDFWDLGDEYNDENSYKWRCFAFNKPKDGTKTIRGNGEDTGVFGYDRWDIGEDEYDIYVLKDYIDYSKEELVENAIDSYYLDNSDYIVQGILRKYVTDVFENHMSDYAKFWIYELMNSDVDKNMVIAYCEGTDYSEINAIKDEFDNIYDARMFLYPAIEGWYEGLEKELTEAYEKAGWVKSKSYEPDWNNSDIPGGVMGLCFVKLTDD